jgi:ATP-dependent helicase HrpA
VGGGIVPGGEGALAVRGYPALVAGPAGVDLRLLTSAAEAAAANPVGARELLLGELALPARRLTSRLTPEAALALAASHYPSADALTRDAQAAVVDAAVAAAGMPRDRAAYTALAGSLRDTLEDRAHAVLLAAADLARQGREVEAQAGRAAEAADAAGVLDSLADIRDHAAELLGAGFLTRAGLGRLADLRRYLAGDAYRLPRLGTARAREEQALWLVGDLRRAYDAAVAAAGPPLPEALAEIPWMLEELRISLLAQPLGTAYPISEKRIRRVLAAV